MSLIEVGDSPDPSEDPWVSPHSGIKYMRAQLMINPVQTEAALTAKVAFVWICARCAGLVADVHQHDRSQHGE